MHVPAVVPTPQAVPHIIPRIRIVREVQGITGVRVAAVLTAVHLVHADVRTAQVVLRHTRRVRHTDVRVRPDKARQIRNVRREAGQRTILAIRQIAVRHITIKAVVLRHHTIVRVRPE